MKNKWIDYEQSKPPVGIEVLAQSDKWIDEDFNIRGIRLGFQNEGDDGYFISAKWNNYHDAYDTIDDINPTKWKHF